MKVFHAAIVTSATALALICAVSVGAADRSSGDLSNKALRIVVKYDELDLSSDVGAAKLYSRLRIAAQRVCAPFESRELSRRAAWSACYNEALSNAVIQVNREAVTALHQHAVHSDRTS
jgi:UrcA family protein